MMCISGPVGRGGRGDLWGGPDVSLGETSSAAAFGWGGVWGVVVGGGCVCWGTIGRLTTCDHMILEDKPPFDRFTLELGGKKHVSLQEITRQDRTPTCLNQIL